MIAYNNKKQTKKIYTGGMSIIEILIGCSIIVIGIIALSSTFTKYVTYALGNENNIQAAYLAEEGLEAMTFLREKSWTTYITPLVPGTTYYFSWDTTNLFWNTTTVPQYVGTKFLRKITIADVNRDGSDEIAVSGTNDPDTQKVTVSVEYFQGHATSTRTLTTYITNLNDN